MAPYPRYDIHTVGLAKTLSAINRAGDQDAEPLSEPQSPIANFIQWVFIVFLFGMLLFYFMLILLYACLELSPNGFSRRTYYRRSGEGKKFRPTIHSHDQYSMCSDGRWRRIEPSPILREQQQTNRGTWGNTAAAAADAKEGEDCEDFHLGHDYIYYLQPHLTVATTTITPIAPTFSHSTPSTSIRISEAEQRSNDYAYEDLSPPVTTYGDLRAVQPFTLECPD